MESWFTRHPQWFAQELKALRRAYPQFVLDEGKLQDGLVVLYGELIVRPPGGAKRHPVLVSFPSNSPYGFPTVFPIKQIPNFNGNGAAESTAEVEFFDYRHQLVGGSLCLFEYDTRVEEGGESISVVDVLKRAEEWFLGHATGRWPQDSIESDLQSHFKRSQGILLGDTFFDESLHGRGEFFAVCDIHRVFTGDAKREPPLIMTAATMSNGLVKVIDARHDLERIFPWLPDDRWQPQAFFEWQERQRKQQEVGLRDMARVNGYWWQLPSEPGVFRNGKGLLGVLSSVTNGEDPWPMVRAALGTDLTTHNVQHIGLYYPGRSGRREWLFLKVKTGSAKGRFGVGTDEEKRERFEKAEVTCMPTYGATLEDINFRNKTVVKSVISQTKVAILGLGALGSKVAELLAQAGVSHFRLCDGDRMNIGNVARHIGGLRDFDTLKTEVVVRRIWEINPNADIQVSSNYFNPTQAEIEASFAGLDLIICTIADEGTESIFNDLAVAINTPVIYGRALRRGQMGRVFLVRPQIDACKTCLSMISKENDPEWISIKERPEDALLHECGRPVIAGSAVDLSFVAGFIARQAIDVLEGRNPTANHLIWSREAAADVSEKLNLPYSVVQAKFSPKAQCPSCGLAIITVIELPESVRAEITREVTASPTVETGGILIGRIDGSKAMVVRATGPGPNAIRTAIRFEKDNEFLQAELEAEIAKGTDLVYLGEWHSHLVASPVPSGQDVLSMIGIAEAKNYVTDCPVMMICGYDQMAGSAGELKAWVFPVNSSGRRATIIDGSAPLTPHQNDSTTEGMR